MAKQKMSRRLALRQIAAAASGICLTGRGFAESQAPKRPNVLFLFTDDQTFRSIGSLNNPAVKTPNIDRLVRNGVTFTHAFNQGSWTGAVCVASRAMLNTGRYIYHARRDIGTQKQEASVPLWGETFGKAGYDTFMTGKWHNGDLALQRSFKQVGPHGGGMFPSTDTDGGAYRRPAPDNDWRPYDKTLKGHWRKQDDGKIIHSSREWANAAVKFLKKRASGGSNPFFMYVAFHAPHDPRQSPKKFVDMYPLDSIEIPPNFLPEHPFDQGSRYTLRDEILAPFPRTEHAVKVHLQEYYAIISHADAQIGRILDALEKSGEADNTIIVFSADHGLAVGQHGLMGKQNQYDHSIRMPLIFCGPGIEKDVRNDALVYLHSAYATTCDLADIPIPETVEFP
ncbi:MAG: sulfatase-like hydrolase/transferase, partial [Candidatus Hinthialibacter sp.]